MTKPMNKARRVRVIPYDSKNKQDKKCAKIAEQILNSPWVQVEIEHKIHEYRKKLNKEMIDRFKDWFDDSSKTITDFRHETKKPQI